MDLLYLLGNRSRWTPATRKGVTEHSVTPCYCRQHGLDLNQRPLGYEPNIAGHSPQPPPNHLKKNKYLHLSEVTQPR
jgi:hypothetical protein